MTYRLRMLAVALTLALCSSTAYAAPTDAERSVAVALFVEGSARFDAGQYAAALELFKRAHAIVHAPTTGFGMAKAHAALGQLVEARAAADEVVHIPVKPDEKPIFAEARADAQEAIKALDSRIPFMQLHIVGPSVQVAHIEVDGKTLSPEDVGKPYAANPGKHDVVVSAPDHHQATSSVVLVESEMTPVDVIVKLDRLPPAPPPPPSPSPPPAVDSAKPAMRHIIVGATGGVLLLAGVGTGIGAGSTYKTMSDAKTGYDIANRSFCDAICMGLKRDYENRQIRLQTLTITTTALGVVGLGAVLFAILDKPAPGKADASFFVAPTPNGAVFLGVW